MAETGYKSPTTTGFTLQGNNHNQWTSPTDGYSDNSIFATAIDGASRLAQQQML
jgi:hypothetical protein